MISQPVEYSWIQWTERHEKMCRKSIYRAPSTINHFNISSNGDVEKPLFIIFAFFHFSYLSLHFCSDFMFIISAIHFHRVSFCNKYFSDGDSWCEFRTINDMFQLILCPSLSFTCFMYLKCWSVIMMVAGTIVIYRWLGQSEHFFLISRRWEMRGSLIFTF